MSSPFPGMDPYLERYWPDVHTKLVTYAADSLNERLPNDLVASTEERVAVRDDEDVVDGGGGAEAEQLVPDVSLLGPEDDPQVIASTSDSAVLAPIRLVTLGRPAKERFIRILEAQTERLVTVIEFLSPANKRGAGRKAYRKKRATLLAAKSNVVEVDLVRRGDWRRLLRPHRCPANKVTAYRATVRTPSDLDSVYLQPIALRAAVPAINVPLRRGEPPVSMDLQSLLARCYANGRYALRMNYDQDPVPRLDAEDADWADQLLRAAGRRRPPLFHSL